MGSDKHKYITFDLQEKEKHEMTKCNFYREDVRELKSREIRPDRQPADILVIRTPWFPTNIPNRNREVPPMSLEEQIDLLVAAR